MGMPEGAVVPDPEAAVSCGAGDGTPAGDATEDSKMKSSRFIGSGCGLGAGWRSTDCRSCAMPLGAVVWWPLKLDATVGGGSISPAGLSLQRKHRR